MYSATFYYLIVGVNMKSTVVMRVASVVFVAALASTSSYAAEATGAVVSNKVASGVATAASAVVLKPGVATNKPATTAGSVVGRAGDNQYPSGTPVVPPKPKKEGLEAAGAIKAKAAQP
ncbi:MAG: hypothetical protein EPO09_20230 [Aquabacterium sp.]|nr:MAG: hypothetical protein EPO09_20230 [Aquabacterium sp.]